MNFKMMRRLVSALVLLACFNSVFSQDSIPLTNPIDSTKIDTVVIRRTLVQIKHVPRSVNLTNPVISFNKTKALKNKPSRFRVPSFWTKKNSFTLNFNEVAFVNWNAGGNNSVSGVGKLRFDRNYKFRYIQWDNYMELRYGLNAQEDQKLRKTDDALKLGSTFGYRRDTITNWYYSVKTTFNTQFSNGYKYPDRTNPISRFMAPGYFFLGAGTSFITANQKFNLYISPLTQKATFVLDQDLADSGSFGVEGAEYDDDGNVITPGENTYIELGFMITNKWETNIGKNVSLAHDLTLYSDYLSSFGNIDVDWELALKLQVNKSIITTIGTHLIYDDDILFDQSVDDDGTVTFAGRPKIQFKQSVGVGITFEF